MIREITGSMIRQFLFNGYRELKAVRMIEKTIKCLASLTHIIIIRQEERYITKQGE